ncbi:MAG: hypothetical protein U5K75_08985 [Ahrensia sp.]|nr:hypothetical protein [Ahrensia sp.]
MLFNNASRYISSTESPLSAADRANGQRYLAHVARDCAAPDVSTPCQRTLPLRQAPRNEIGRPIVSRFVPARGQLTAGGAL